MSHKNAEQVFQEYVEKMGAELGAVYYRLYNECAWLHFKWAKYDALFGTSEARVDLLNSIAPETTRVIQDCMWHDILIHLSRLTDRVEVGGKQTLTVHRQLQHDRSAST